ncbi:MAG TPA: VCBS repeat-containing protein [Isosphaeraceae bacterium]|jgi:hypothetical protein|nr:VCBS repeat-containing protein [Isosphaeraceae bacterium]
MRMLRWTIALVVAAPAVVVAADFPRFEARTIDPHVGNVCYAVTTADVDGDGKLDVVALAEDAAYWYANPSWEKHTLIKDATARDNVCIQAHDLDGDGRVDFAVGASWQPTNTKSGGTIQWLKREGKDGWKVVPIATEPTIHRIRWGDVLGSGKKQLVVAPLQGRGTKGPNWGEGQGVRIMVFSVSDDPTRSPWPMEVADDSLHTVHNFQLLDFDGDGRDDIVLASWEGVFVLRRDPRGHWSKTKLGSGNQESSPSKGASEIKVGRLGDGRRYLATIEPWHGFQVVVYTPPASATATAVENALWRRQVVDEPVQWGHAVWCADLDGDGDDELIIGQRDPNKPGAPGARGPGVWAYDPKADGDSLRFTKHLIDDGGIGCEDLVAADLDADGRPDIVAGGRSTHNVKVYLNRKSAE